MSAWNPSSGNSAVDADTSLSCSTIRATAAGATRAGLFKASRTRRVTHVVWDFDGGGLESIVASLARHFAGSELHMSVVSLSGSIGRTGESVRSSLESLRAYRPIPIASMVAPLGLAALLRELRSDVVHLHSGVWYKGAVAARLARVPRVVFTEHGREHHDTYTARHLDRIASLMTSAVVPVSARLARYLVERVGVNPKKIHTVENGIDTDVFRVPLSRADARAALGIPSDSLIVGSAGRFQTVKGFDRLIRAFAMLMGNGTALPSVYLAIAGDGPERHALEQLARELGVGELVCFPGWVTNLVTFYQALDVFALASHSEGLSLSLLEAMACGAVPVVTDVGANAEVLGAALAGQVAPATGSDLQEFSRILRGSLESANRRSDLSAAARRRVVKRYSLERMASAYAQLYTARQPTDAPVPARTRAATVS